MFIGETMVSLPEYKEGEGETPVSYDFSQTIKNGTPMKKVDLTKLPDIKDVYGSDFFMLGKNIAYVPRKKYVIHNLPARLYLGPIGGPYN